MNCLFISFNFHCHVLVESAFIEDDDDDDGDDDEYYDDNDDDDEDYDDDDDDDDDDDACYVLSNTDWTFPTNDWNKALVTPLKEKTAKTNKNRQTFFEARTSSQTNERTNVWTNEQECVRFSCWRTEDRKEASVN